MFCALERELWPENLPSFQAVEARNKTSKLTWPAFDEREVIMVDNGYRTPAILHIDRLRRLALARKYYRANRFRFGSAEVGSKFFDILGAEQRILLAQELTIHLDEHRFKGLADIVEVWAAEYREVSPVVWFAHSGGRFGYRLLKFNAECAAGLRASRYR